MARLKLVTPAYMDYAGDVSCCQPRFGLIILFESEHWMGNMLEVLERFQVSLYNCSAL